MARLIFVNRFYWPDQPATAQLLTDLAEAFAAQGQSVTVIASAPRDCPAYELRNGVAIRRVRSTRSPGRGLLRRAGDLATFYPGAMWRLFRMARKNDTVVAMTDPPLLGVIVWLIARLRGARLIHWVQDIYPEIATEITGNRWPLLLRPLRDFTWKHASACVVPGTDMAQVLAEAAVPPAQIVVVPNWAPEGVSPPAISEVRALRQEWGLDAKFVAAYSGNLGRVHDLDPLLDVANELREDSSIVILFIGQGAQCAALKSAAHARSLQNVRFLPPQPLARLAVALGAGDIHFVTLLPGCERYVYPSKLYGIAAVGRPVVFIGPRECELARTVSEGRFGETFTRDDVTRMANALRELQANPLRRTELGAAALKFAQGGPNRAVEAWSGLVRAPRSPHSSIR